MAAKIQLKNGKIGTFGGIFSALDYFNQIGLSQLIDNTLDIRDIQAKYAHSDIVKTMLSIYLCGGTAIEDANVFRNETYSRNPGCRFCSPDTILKSFAELQKINTEIESAVGKKYNFNINDNLNLLLVKSLLQCGLLEGDEEMVLDYDNLFIATEKQDAKYSYKGKFGYFPGIAQINLHPFYIENRDGNANVKLKQAETLKRAFKMLSDNEIAVNKAVWTADRMPQK